MEKSNEKAMLYIKECAESVGLEVIEDKTAFSINFMAEIMKRLRKEPCEDTISRKAVNTLVDELARAISDERCNMSRGRSTATIMQDILDLPPVNSQPKTGHWIKVTNGRGGHECDVCHNYAPSYQTGDEHLTTFCPNCSAKMESEEKNNV